MKPPGGSRRDPAGVAPGPNHGDAGVGGASDDAELLAMRAVWREMRDEEPPGGGLAELLAAARVKAEAMQPRPSWWQRLVATLRRPPVMALATAMVLLAGAAILGRRGVGPLSRAEDVVSEGAVARTAAAQANEAAIQNAVQANEAAMQNAVQVDEAALRKAAQAEDAAALRKAAQAEDAAALGAVRAGDAAAGRAAHTGDAAGAGAVYAGEAAAGRTAKAPTDDAAAQRTALREAAAGPGTGPPARAVRPTGPRPEVPALHEAHRVAHPPAAIEAPAVAAAKSDRDGASAGSSQRSSGHGSAAAETARAAAIVSRVGSAASGEADDGEESGRARKAAPSTDAAAAPAGARSPGSATSGAGAPRAVRPPASATSGADTSAASPARRAGPAATELSRLHQQCESAARRGDCPAVRQLVDRITRTDRGYRGRVAKDSAVAKCLAE